MDTFGLTLSIAGIAVSLYALFPRLDDFTAAFFSLSPDEQAGCLGLLFFTIFGGLTLIPFLTGVGGVSKKKKQAEPVSYPFDAMAATASDHDKFMVLYPVLRDEILEELQAKNEQPPEAVAWCKELMDYSVPGGKLNRGTTVMAVLRSLLGRSLTPLEECRACAAGWSIEFLQAFFLVADDLMDDSQTRRGQPCWYKVPKVGLIAINDSFLLESFVYSILSRHFGHESYYADLVELLQDVIQKTEFGQLLDLTSQPADGKIDLTRFTLTRYRQIVKYKTAFYSFYLPVALGMHLAGIRDEASFELARRICCKMGDYFQVQDDYLDCFGTPEVIGKVGTDIQDNKCSWLVIQALERVTPDQKKVLEQNYGVWDDKKVAKIKKLYEELDLQKVFHDYEEESYKSIQADLDLVTTMPRDVFEILLKKIYKRSK